MIFYRCLFTLLMVLAGAGATQAQQVQEAHGYVQEVDATNGTITLTTFAKGKVLGVKSFNLLKPDIPVVNLAGQALKLSDIKAEALVTLKLNAEEDVVSVIAPLPTVRGTLKEVNPKANTIVVDLRTGPQTIIVDPKTKIYVNAAPAAFKDLTVGDETNVTFTQDRNAVVEVRSGKGVGPYLYPTKRMGALIEVDKDKRLARIFRSNPNGDISALREIPLAKDATFSLNYQHRPVVALKIEEVTKGFSMWYWTEPVYNRIVHMDLDMPLLARRQVKALDREKRSLTILENDVERVLTLSPRVRVLSPRGPGKLDDVVPGLIVDCGLHADRKQIEVLVLQPN